MGKYRAHAASLPFRQDADGVQVFALEVKEVHSYRLEQGLQRK
jgi:hypothetical protein